MHTKPHEPGPQGGPLTTWELELNESGQVYLWECREEDYHLYALAQPSCTRPGQWVILYSTTEHPAEFHPNQVATIDRMRELLWKLSQGRSRREGRQ